jgi:hypothetical protein
MNRVSICANPECRFILDLRLNGRSMDGVRSIVSVCPECGSAWSSDCPFCSQALALKFVAGVPQSECCGRKLRAEVRTT